MSVTALLVGLFLLSAADPVPEDPWASHPALQPYNVSGQQLPEQLYLVRGSRALPPITGVTVHGEYEHVSLVSGDSKAVFLLSELGFGVYPLQPLPEDFPAIQRAPGPQWEPRATRNPDIVKMVQQVNWTGVGARIQWLEDFGTRYSYAPSHLGVATAISDVFTSFGLSPNIQSFVYDHTTMYNVVATHTGTVYPSKVWIICGHFDSVSGSPLVSAPGADDNATGTAAVLTAAEILTQYQFEYSIRFICFGGEEQGLRGSQAYAEMANNLGMDIQGVINFDMLGYWEPGVDKDLEIETNVASRWLADVILHCANTYTDAGYELHVNDNAWWGDHASFWTYGYAAVNHEESYDWYDPDFNPYYHTANDLIEYIDPDFTVDNVQVAVATLATLAGPVPQETATTRYPGQTEPPDNIAIWMGMNPF
jgi:hypothetical protein